MRGVAGSTCRGVGRFYIMTVLRTGKNEGERDKTEVIGACKCFHASEAWQFVAVSVVFE